MLPGTARVMRRLPAHLVAKPDIPQSVVSDTLTTICRSSNKVQYHLLMATARIHAGKCSLSIPFFLLV